MDAAGLKSRINSLIDGSEVGASQRSTRRICCDSRQIKPGDVFVAVKGVHVDGNDFITDAVARGAQVVVAQQPVPVGQGVELVLVDDSARALAELAQASRGQPSKKLKVLGVTGTNGKTTVAYLTRAMLRAGGMGCGMVGTVEYDLGDGHVQKADNTTPDAVQLAEMMARMCDNGLEAMVMECSSHGLDQQRTAAIDFQAAAFTNLSGDHLDYHGSIEAYLTAKSRLFEGLGEDATAVLNAQDKASKHLAKLTRAKVWYYGLDGDYDIAAEIQDAGLWGTRFGMKLLGEELTVHLSLPGAYNVSNCLAAAALARAAGVSVEAIGSALAEFNGVPGRLERIEGTKDFTVLVDYAHTDDALRHVLETVRALTQRKLIVVFGCGGDRDRSKRPRMAQAVEKWADRIILTNDNPRRESPADIFGDVRAGFSAQGKKKVTEIAQRRQAIEFAIGIARKDDVVLIAGKGHEDYQILGDKRIDFDDRKVVREVFQRTIEN